MGRDSEDKAGRILSIYTRLKQGKVIYKQEESIRYGVAERTIQRDIVDIQCFLEEHASTSGEIQEIIFEKALGGLCTSDEEKDPAGGKRTSGRCKNTVGEPGTHKTGTVSDYSQTDPSVQQ